MILQNMTPEEKLRQVEIVKPYVKAIAERAAQTKLDVFKRATRFPAFLFLPEKEIKDMGKWTVVLVAESKGTLRKGLFTWKAFQTFEVTTSKKEINNGTGIYCCHPQVGSDVWCCEFPPHYFSRLRQRMIEPKGIAQPEFQELVRELFRLHHHCVNVINEGEVIMKGEDGLYDVVKNPKLERRPGYDDCAAYHKEGISLGLCINRRYFHFTTFVSSDLLKCPQEEMQKRQLKDARDHELRMRYDSKAQFVVEEMSEGHVKFGL